MQCEPMTDSGGMGLDGLVIISGIPGSGKTTLARSLSQELDLPLVSKDTIKEALFDALGTGDLAWSQSLGRASHRVMYALARDMRSAVLESHFWRGMAEDELRALKRPMVQVHCRCPVDEALRRYRQRTDSTERHPGHLPEHQSKEVTDSWSTVEPVPLELSVPLFEIDTTHAVDVRDLAARVVTSMTGDR